MIDLNPRHRPGPRASNGGALGARDSGVMNIGRRVFTGAVLISLSVALLGCSSSPGQSAGPPATRPTTSTSTTMSSVVSSCGVEASPPVTFTTRSEPCDVTMHVGDVIRLRLDRGFIWGDPKSSADIVEVEGIVRPAGGGLDADLRAIAAGRATVMTTGTVACAPGQACPQLARLWELDVAVTV